MSPILNTDLSTLLHNIFINSNKGLKEVKQGSAKAYPVAIVGGGPSLNDTYGELDKFDRVIATNNTHDWLIERGVKPWAYVLCDAKEETAEFLNHPKKYIKYFISSKCHPKVFEKLKGFNVTIFHEDLGIGEPENVARISGGSTVALKCLNLFAFQGYLAFYLFGVDSCYKDDKHHAYQQSLNDNEEIQEFVINGKIFKCAAWMMQQAEDFKGFIGNFGQVFKVFVVGDGLLSEIARGNQ